MKVAITGANGFLGGALRAHLETAGHTALPVSVRRREPLPPCDAVVHLAGEPIAQRWTAEAKRRILESRVEGTRRVVEDMATLADPPRVLVSASAVGLFGDRGDEVLTETSAPGTGFLSEVCLGWETAARAADEHGVRVVLPRFGIILAKHEGALARMLLPFRFGVGGRLGPGRQWMSWAHVDDAIALIARALRDDSIRGPLHVTAPNPVTNREFTRELAAALHRPAVMPVPAWALRLALGEMSHVLLDSARVVPQAALTAGFGFQYPELGSALRDLLA